MFAILSSGKFNVTSGLNDKSGFGMPKIVIPSPLLFNEDGLTPFAFNLIVLFVRNEPSNSFFLGMKNYIIILLIILMLDVLLLLFLLLKNLFEVIQLEVLLRFFLYQPY